MRTSNTRRLAQFAAIALLSALWGRGLTGEPDTRIMTVDLGANADRRMEVFGTAETGSIFHRWQTSDSPEWADWQNVLGDQIQSLQVFSADRRLFVVGIDRGALIMTSQVTANGSWSDQVLRTGEGLRTAVAASNAQGIVVVAAIGANGVLYTMRANVTTPQPVSADWSGWEAIGGSGLEELAIAQDGDGRLTIGSRMSDTRMYVVQEREAGADGGWEEWAPLEAGEIGRFTLARGVDKTLWLLAIGRSGWLYGRALARVGTEVESSERAERMATRPGPKRNPRAERPSPPPDIRATRSSPRLPHGNWSDWALLIPSPLANLNLLAATSDLHGRVQLAGVANETTVLAATQNGDGSWPQVWVVLAATPGGDPSAIAIEATADSRTTIAITQRADGRVAAISRAATESWAASKWTELGKIPGAQDPDVRLAMRVCMDALIDVAGLDAEDRRRSAARLRADIVGGVRSSLSKALLGSPLASVLGNVNASTRCTPQGEILALWLDHEVWPGAYQQDAGISDGAGYSYRIFAESIRGIVADQLQTVANSVQTVRIEDYDLKLKAPGSLEIRIDGSLYGTDVDADIEALLYLSGDKPACRAELRAGRPNGLYAIASIFVIPAVAIPTLVQFGDGIEEELLAPARSKVDLLCGLKDAIPSLLFVPREPGDPLRVVDFGYTSISANEDRGIEAAGVLPILRAPRPSIEMGYFPVSPPPITNSTTLHVGFVVDHKELKPPLQVTWTTSLPSLRLANHPGLRGDFSNFAFFVFAVAPDSEPATYDLGTATVRVVDSEGQMLEVARPITIRTYKSE